MFQNRFKGLCELVGTGGLLITTSNSFKLADGLLGFHSLNQACDALQVSMATAIESHTAYRAVIIKFQIYLPRAGALGGVTVFHWGMRDYFLSQSRRAFRSFISMTLLLVALISPASMSSPMVVIKAGRRAPKMRHRSRCLNSRVMCSER